MAKKKKVLKLKREEKSLESSLPKEARLSFSIPVFTFGAILLMGVSFWVGYLIRPELKNTISSLRLNNNYKYISPLLACDTEMELESEKTESINQKISSYVDKVKKSGDISNVSVYLRDYDGGFVMNYNPDTKYNQASLSKVVVMMKILEMSSHDKDYLNKTFTYEDATDYNEGLEIKPTKVLIKGQQYSIDEALHYMVEYSDNNATYYLMSILDQSTYDNIYKDLKISPPSDEQIQNYLDFRTAKEYSYFFRVLYNATYLDRDSSEKAIGLLTNSAFNDGLEAGVPAEVTIAHKFGILNHLVDGKPERELHDCGIVYKNDSKPYLICVMTKSSGSLETQKAVIRDISRLSYDELRK